MLGGCSARVGPATVASSEPNDSTETDNKQLCIYFNYPEAPYFLFFKSRPRKSFIVRGLKGPLIPRNPLEKVGATPPNFPGAVGGWGTPKVIDLQPGSSIA
jgi:hypothetical protein